MSTEKEKMITGKLYDSLDAELVAGRLRARNLMRAINAELDDDKRQEFVKEAFGGTGKAVFVEPYISFDYGFNIHVGENFYMNFNGSFLDTCPIVIGDNCMFGPNVGIYCATHPLDPVKRNSGQEYGKPITIGNNAWFGAGVIVLPGVTLGNNVVVGGGSVVTKSFGDNVVLGGNPARIIKKLDVHTEKIESRTAEEQLAELRAAIDAVDKKLAPLLVERLELSKKVGEVKSDAGLPIFNGGREQQILAKYVKNPDDVAEHFLGETFLSIIGVSKDYQKIIIKENGE